MNRRLLTLLAAISLGTFAVLAGLFFAAAYYSGEKTVTQVSSEVHAAYLREIIYNYRNDLVSGNYRFFRNQIASLMDHEVFSDYALLQDGKEVETSEHFSDHIGQPGFLRISVPVWFDEGKTQLWGTVDLLVNESHSLGWTSIIQERMQLFFGITLLLSLLLAATYVVLWERLNLSLGREVEAVFEGRPGSTHGLAGLIWRPTLGKLRTLKTSHDELAKCDVLAQKQLTMVEITRQVAHDIRSPLAALNLVSSQLAEVGEEKRQLIRHAVQRIRDIAHDLDQKGSTKASLGEEKSSEPTMLLSLIDLVVSEKRAQYAHRKEVRIEAELNEGYGLFSLLHAPSIRRALSNLIDNGVEALSSRDGLVQVCLDESLCGRAQISVRDNGCGIPESHLASLGLKGTSYRKEGSGLGLFQARTATEASNGSLQIESKVGQGTCVTLHFPKCEPPSWFLGTLQLPNDAMVIAVDDDVSIHALWKDRIQANPMARLSSLTEAEEWLSGNSKFAKRRLFLFDYDFRGEFETGLDAIDRLGLASESVLVTSRFEDPTIQERCRRLGLKMIPKVLAPLVPVHLV